MAGFYDLNLKMLLILAILIFMSSLNVMLSKVEHEKSFITSEPSWKPRRQVFSRRGSYLRKHDGILDK